MKYLLDTNVVSELIAKQPNQSVLDWVDAQDPNSLFLSVITIGELQKGITKLPTSERKTTLQSWLTNNLLTRFQGHILAFDIEVSLVWGSLTGRLAQIGRPLAALDSLIAAMALSHGCTVATRNEDDFADTGVAVINPWKGVDAT
ncbi:MAG: type II toxin-antitoxin system VapC family toxin [Chloroflexaceae bacterium]|nr:type II toxin-antitoxin system VapC family toxin [Chloroflexaceae bacterium]